jgi:hypothetical protein
VAWTELAAEDYLTDFWRQHARAVGEFWKLECRQTVQEPESDSWCRLAEGSWDEALALLPTTMDSVARRYRADNGFIGTRVRVVEESLTPYVHWEMHALQHRVGAGERISVLSVASARAMLGDTELPELVGLGDKVLYRVNYDDQGQLLGAARATEPAAVGQVRDQVVALFEQGEEFDRYFAREVADLPPPRDPT